MPIGLIIFSWNKRIGAEIFTKYPDDFQVSNDTLMRIFSTHAFEEGGGFLSMIIGALNIASYYSGPDLGYYISLFLSLEEDPDLFEDAVLDAANLILSHRDLEQVKPLIPSLYSRMALYPKLTDEQKLATILLDRAKAIIIKNLDEDGSNTKGELANLLLDQLEVKYFDIDAALNSLIKLGLVKVSSVKGLPSEGVFLIGNVFVTRVPPLMTLRRLKQLGLSTEVEKDYLSEITDFFQQYIPSPSDNQQLLEIVANTDTYIILNLLRLAPVTEHGLNKVKNQVEDMNSALKKLWDANLLRMLKNKQGEELYLLKSDIRIQKYFPEYIINTIRKSYNEKTKPNAVLLEHLKLLRDTYLNLPEEFKSKELTPMEETS
ncbi:MAG: hypothetical protein ACTSRS_03465 [Candidatus Helarchaeota archaeon]